MRWRNNARNDTTSSCAEISESRKKVEVHPQSNSSNDTFTCSYEPSFATSSIPVLQNTFTNDNLEHTDHHRCYDDIGNGDKYNEHIKFQHDNPKPSHYRRICQHGYVHSYEKTQLQNGNCPSSLSEDHNMSSIDSFSTPSLISESLSGIEGRVEKSRMDKPLSFSTVTSTVSHVRSSSYTERNEIDNVRDDEVEKDALVNNDLNDEGRDHAMPDDSPSVSWRAQSQQSTCEFTHTIKSYSSKRESGCKKAEYSSTTVDSYGNHWRLIVYVNGNGRASNHHLSLFLQVADADELPFGWKKAVSYVLTLEHSSGPTLGYAKRNPDKTFKLCPKAIDWGWSQFITSDRIQQEGYINNDTLTVRACVTVKSSSVSIDPEDAELYLKCAVEEGNAAAVEACLNQNARVNCQFKDDLYTPLHTACSSTTSMETLEVLRLLLERGADGNACNKWRETPLLIAANNGHKAAVEALLEHGADSSLCSEAGWSALTFAAHKGYDNIVSLLIAAGAPVSCRVTEDLSTPLHKACAGGKAGHISAVKQLLKGGADVHALNKWRETPLLTAANHGQSTAVEALLKAGGDPCKCTDTGWSPLSIAAYKGHDDVVRLLLEQGAPTEEADPTLSALLQAATKGLPDTVDLLLRHGADHTVTTKKGDTALSILVEQNLIDAAVEMVTEYKASVPRCSRDRKKVQRARLLINLRVKRQQKEGLLSGDFNSDDDSDQDESDFCDDVSNYALHDFNGSSKAATPSRGGTTAKKKKKKSNITIKSRESAEAEARAAEEALLLELEREDAKAQKEEAAATSKRRKKKKRKEREKQQKLEEGRVRREKEQKETEARKQREKKLQKERSRKEQEKKEREIREASMQEERAHAKTKEDNEKKNRELEIKESQNELYVTRFAKKSLSSSKISNKASFASPPSCNVVSSTFCTHMEKESLVNNNVNSLPKKTRKQQQFIINTVPSVNENGVTNLASKSPIIGLKKLTTTSNRGWENKNATVSLKEKPRLQYMQLKRWEEESKFKIKFSTAHGPMEQSLEIESPHQTMIEEVNLFHSSPTSGSVEDQLENMANGVIGFLGFDSGNNTENNCSNVVTEKDTKKSSVLQIHSFKLDQLFNRSVTKRNESYGNKTTNSLHGYEPKLRNFELPTVSLFRQQKVVELLQKYINPLSNKSPHVPDPFNVLDEKNVRTVLYKWMVRAAHGHAPYMDPLIPSWTDLNLLITFFQRQLISGNQFCIAKNSNSFISRIEILSELGADFARYCRSLAMEILDYRKKYEDQLLCSWTDKQLNITSKEMLIDGSGPPVVVIDFSGRAQVYVSSLTFSKLRRRFLGTSNHLLGSIFSLVKRYETKRMIVSGSNMDYRLTPSTLSCLEREINVTFELFTDPISVHCDMLFCGLFMDVDAIFGGFPPFCCDDVVKGSSLLTNGGSVVVLPPLDSKISCTYMQQILDILENSEGKGIPLSFALFLRSECFRDMKSVPSMENLALLDNRLLDKHRIFISCVRVLQPGHHQYHYGDGHGLSEISQTGSVFLLLQNDLGRIHYPLRVNSVEHIINSMMVPFLCTYDIESIGSAPLIFPSELGRDLETFPITASPNSNSGIGIIDHSVNGVKKPSIVFSAESKLSSRRRLFELVDDGDDDNNYDVEMVSGMLNNLDFSMFQSSSTQDVDIEAISLMGIEDSKLGKNIRSLQHFK